MDRKFGIELEIVGITRQTALRALSAVGIHVQDESYNHTTRGYWKLVPDGSVRGGFEVVSPILEGERGIEEAMTVAEAPVSYTHLGRVSPLAAQPARPGHQSHPADQSAGAGRGQARGTGQPRLHAAFRHANRP